MLQKGHADAPPAELALERFDEEASSFDDARANGAFVEDRTVHRIDVEGRDDRQSRRAGTSKRVPRYFSWLSLLPRRL